MKILLIENPAAGRRKTKGYLKKVLRVLESQGAEVTHAVTARSGEASRLAREGAAEADLVVCAGGDGTLHEVVSGLMTRPHCPRVGYIPTGTSNDLAHTLGLSQRPRRAAEAILHGQDLALDVGAFNDTHFVYLASFGTLSEVAYSTPQKQKNRWGWGAYLVHGARQLKNIRAFHAVVEHDGGREEGDYAFCAVSNSRRIGGGIIRYGADDVALDDGAFELMLIKRPATFPQMLGVLLKLLRRQYDTRYVTMCRTAHVHVTAQEPIPWCLDGEGAGAQSEADIAVMEGALRLATPSRTGTYPIYTA